MQANLIIIDGYSFVFRAFYGLPALSRKSDGLEIGALYGFIRMMLHIRTIHQPSHIIVVFDTGGKTFRHQLYDQYKANRSAAPEELIHQFALVRNAVLAMNMQYLEMDGYEADDIIATLVKKYILEKITIISSDKDLMQLIKPNILMYDSVKSQYIDKNYVYNKFQIYPEQLLDFLSIVGF